MALKNVTYEQLLTSLKKKEYAPVYLLMGEEPYFIDQISDYLSERLLSEDEKVFNQTILYGKDTDMETVISVAKRYPMMSPYQLVMVKEAQHLKSYDELLFYLQKPMPGTVLVFCYKYGTIDRRKKVISEVDKIGIVFESKKMYENQLPGWIDTLAESLGVEIDKKASNMMAEFLGNDLSRIANEMEKLLVSKPSGTAITPELIERNIGISKDYNNFELVNALAVKDILKSNRIVDYFKKNKKNNPLVVTLSVLFNFFANLLVYHSLADKSQMSVASALRINPYFVKDYQVASRNYSADKIRRIISYIRETDAKGKGLKNASMEDADLLRELIFKILH